MDDKQIAEIETRDATPGPLNIHRLSNTAIVISNPNGMKDSDLILFANARADKEALIAEVRRLRAVLAEYADRENWGKSSTYCDPKGYDDLWVPNEHGYTRAENVLKDGE